MNVSSKTENEDLVIEIRLDKHDQLCLNNDIEDIVDWYSKGPSYEKIFNCRQRMIEQNKEKLMKQPDMQSKTMAEINALFEDPRQIVEAIAKMPEYKNRKQRDASLNMGNL